MGRPNLNEDRPKKYIALCQSLYLPKKLNTIIEIFRKECGSCFIGWREFEYVFRENKEFKVITGLFFDINFL